MYRQIQVMRAFLVFFIVMSGCVDSVADNKRTTDGKNFTNLNGTVMVWIAPGRVEADVRVVDPVQPAVPVSRRTTIEIKRGFWLASMETTLSQFKAFLEDSKYTPASVTSAGKRLVHSVDSITGAPVVGKGAWNAPGFPQSDDHPVTTVSVEDAVAFCEWMSRREKRMYRLPNEDEWHFALLSSPREMAKENLQDQAFQARFPTKAKAAYDWNDGFVYTAPVGQFRSTKNGLFDMGGNVAELTSPMKPSDYPLKLKAVIQGGDWEADTRSPREGDRVYLRASGMTPTWGFRVACESAVVTIQDGPVRLD